MSITLQEDRILGQRPRLQEACIRLYEMAQQLGAGEKLPTMVELRSQLGISVHTLNDAVRELEKRDILSSVRGVGIYVAQKRQGIATGNVGFVTLNHKHNNHYWGMLLAGMREELSKRDYHLMLIDSVATFDRWDKIDGAIISYGQDSRSSHQEAKQPPRGFPCLTILNQVPPMSCVDLDDFDGTYQLTRHLIQLGHRRIAYLTRWGVNLTQLEARKEGYLKALLEAGIEPDPRWMRQLLLGEDWAGVYVEAGEYHTRSWLQEDWEDLGCTALVTQNDDTARGAINAFEAAGLEVPGDVSVTGFDGLLATDRSLQLTTIQSPLFELGQQAITSLLDWLEDPSRPPRDARMPVRLIEGQTTAGVREALVTA